MNESKIQSRIDSVNQSNQKALTIFLTSGYPKPESFIDLALGVVDNGADILEIGVPFGDSLADGPVIQSSYTEVLKQNIGIERTFEFVSGIRKHSDVPIILMGSGNPILRYGRDNFIKGSLEAGVNGVIVPDVPLEEYDDFYENDFNELDTILLTTPTSSPTRINEIDNKSSGFVYCVSVVGITGVRNGFDKYVLENLKLTYNTIKKNKMQIGFGISSMESIKQFSPFCDGFIVGSAVTRLLSDDNEKYSNTFTFIKELKSACHY